MLRYVVNQGVSSMFHAGGRVNFAAIGANAFGMGFGSAEMFRSVDYASGQEGKLNEFAATADGDDADSGAAMRATAVSAPYRGCGLNPYTASGVGLRHGDLRAAPILTAAMKRSANRLKSVATGWYDQRMESDTDGKNVDGVAAVEEANPFIVSATAIDLVTKGRA